MLYVLYKAGRSVRTWSSIALWVWLAGVVIDHERNTGVTRLRILLACLSIKWADGTGLRTE